MAAQTRSAPRTAEPIRVAFVGCGAMARLHAAAMGRISVPTVIVGAQDAAAAVAKEFTSEFGGRPFGSAALMMEGAHPQAVHVCTPAGTHFEPARAAIEAGAHIYVEKPFVETAAQATQLLDRSAARGLIVCAGHQLLFDPAYRALLEAGPRLGGPLSVESRFTFAPPFDPDTTAPPRVAHQLLDILPHPLYTLLDAMQRLGEPAATELIHVTADPAQVHAVFQRGGLRGVLVVSLRGRPIVSNLSVMGTGGTLSCDFVRSALIGAANPGTSPVEKILNPLAEGWQLQWRSVRSVARRVLGGGHYPGLAELLDAFYGAIAAGAPSPLPPEHLHEATRTFEQLATRVADSLPTPSTPHPRPALHGKRVAVVTGATGFFGRHICAALARRGWGVRGIARTPNPELESVHEWVAADLSRGLSATALDGADVVIHAAAATSGGVAAHQRHSVDASRHVVQAMEHAGVHRLIYISSISVLEPPRTPWERQDERTPLASRATDLGPYTWGKTEAERLVRELTRDGPVTVRIIRPAALVDLKAPDMPGLLGRRLLGSLHLGLGRPGLPFAMCDVQLAAEVVEWSAEHFSDTPPVINLWDPAYSTRRDAVAGFRAQGWGGRMIWVPIRPLGVAAHLARLGFALLRGRLPSRIAIVSILKPRRYDPDISRQLLDRVSDRAHPRSVGVEPTPAGTSRAARSELPA